jgi:hypothetical protein
MNFGEGGQVGGKPGGLPDNGIPKQELGNERKGLLLCIREDEYRDACFLRSVIMEANKL